MTPSEFEGLLERRLAKVRDTLIVKAREYATDKDRLHNFKKASAIIHKTPAQVCLGYLLKHFVSLSDMTEAVALGDKDVLKLLDEKVTGALNYLLLLEACLTEVA